MHRPCSLGSLTRTIGSCDTVPPSLITGAVADRGYDRAAPDAIGHRATTTRRLGMSRRFQCSGIRAVVLVAAVLLLMLPPIASAQGHSATHRPRGVAIDVSLVCTGDRGATAVISIENSSATPVTLVEVAPAFTFRGPHGVRYHLEVFMLIIPTVVGPGELLTQEVTVVDALLPPDPWVSFHERVKVAVTLWFEGYQRPLTRQVVQPCEPA